MNIAEAITVDNQGGGVYTLSWSAEFCTDPIDICVATSATSFPTKPPLASVRSPISIGGLRPNSRHYFSLRLPNGTEVVTAEREVPIPGAVNFRDLGGYATNDGRYVKWGRLFRSGHLSSLTPEGVSVLRGLEIQAVCDFRTSEELATEGFVFPDNPALSVLEIPPGVQDPQYLHRLFRSTTDPDDIVDALHDIVRSMVNESASRYGALFAVLLASEDRNILINCSAGKERTGVASALILTALGVPRETIYYDFMLSAVYFPAEAEIERVLAKYEIAASGATARALVMPLLETRESYLRVAFDFIDKKFGGGEQFLREQFDIGARELAQLRSMYTA